jgi:hypothetical protein
MNRGKRLLFFYLISDFMRKLLFGLLLMGLAVACTNTVTGSGDYAAYPKEYKEYNLPAYPNATSVGRAEASPLGDDGDIQIMIQLKTSDGISTIKDYYERELDNLGYKKNPNTQLKELQEKGAPVDESNFYSGNFQNGGKVFNLTAMEKDGDVSVNIAFMGS